jgi:hypothetical protein
MTIKEKKHWFKILELAPKKNPRGLSRAILGASNKTSIRKSSAILSRCLKTVTITIFIQINNICMFNYTKLIDFDNYQLVIVVLQIMLFISMSNLYFHNYFNKI